MLAEAVSGGGGDTSLVVAVAGTVLFAGLWFGVVNQWRAEAPTEPDPEPDHAMRCLTVIACALNAAFLSYDASYLRDRGWVSSGLAMALQIPLLLVVVLSLVAFSTIYMFNWPAFLVPPAGRGEVGRVRQWRDGRPRSSRGD